MNDDINGHIESLRLNMSETSGLFPKACSELFGLLTMNLSKDGSTGSP